MKTGKTIMWGIVLIAVGILLGLNSFGLLEFDIFFDGWWTLFIIVPCFISLLTDSDKTGSLIGLVVGILLLLGCQDMIGFDVIGKLIFPIILVLIGISLLFKNTINSKINAAIKNANSSADSEYSAIFTGQEVRIDTEFKGTAVSAVFGGFELDLRNAIITEDTVVRCKAIFGGVDILVPENVKVEVKSSSVFGGIDNKTTAKDKEVTLYVDATCVFGGIDIK